MIAACPECAARYRVDEAKVSARGARMRCAKCSTIFRIPPPEPASDPAPKVAVPPPAQAAAGSQAGPGGLSAEAEYDADRLVVVATGESQIVAEAVQALEAWGLQALAVSHGAEAMLSIQRTLPRAVVLDSGLPGMDGLQICEVIKRNKSLREIRVILISESPDANFAAALGEFGPDVCRAREGLLDDLHGLMGEFELPMSVGKIASSQPAPPPTAAAMDGLDEDRAKAERLARIVVSDIVLYQGEAFDRANRSGTLIEDFAVDLAEGRQLLSDRVDASVCDERDYLVDELMRVAEERRKD